MAQEDALTGEDRCWPCTAANLAAGLLVAVPPLVVASLDGDPVLLLGAASWAALVLGFTVLHLLRRGYLPGADRVARRTGLHDLVGPGRGSNRDGARSEGGDGDPSGADSGEPGESDSPRD